MMLAIAFGLMMGLQVVTVGGAPSPDSNPPTPAAEAAPELSRQLLVVRRVYVEKLNGKDADRIRDLLLASLHAVRTFVITDNPDRADAILRGTAEEVTFQETHESSDGIQARLSTGARTVEGRRLPSAGVSVGDRESLRTSERRQQAVVTLRLVNRDGDLLWSTTQESRGAKFRGAAADAAEKAARQLAQDFQRLLVGNSRPAAPPH